MRSDFQFGLLIGFLGGIALVFLALSISNISWLDRSQGIILGVMALAGAIATVLSIERQISEINRAEKDRIERKALAARTLLPSTLTALTDYAEQCVDELRVRLPSDLSKHPVVYRSPYPSVNEKILSVLSTCVEADERLQGPLLELTAELQLQQARLHRNKTNGYGMLQRALEAIAIHARCGELFEYARGHAGDVNRNLPKSSVENSAGVLGFRRSTDPWLYQILDREFPT